MPVSLLILMPVSLLILKPVSLLILTPISLLILMPVSLLILMPVYLLILKPVSLLILMPVSLLILMPVSLIILTPVSYWRNLKWSVSEMSFEWNFKTIFVVRGKFIINAPACGQTVLCCAVLLPLPYSKPAELQPFSSTDGWCVLQER